MIEIKLPESDKVIFTAVSVKVKCKTCGSTFGFYLLQDFTIPPHFDRCFKCSEDKKLYSESKKKEKLNG